MLMYTNRTMKNSRAGHDIPGSHFVSSSTQEDSPEREYCLEEDSPEK